MTRGTIERSGSGYPAIGRFDVHVWLAVLDRPRGYVAESLRLLSEDELRRASQYKSERYRERFIIRRATLRSILAGYLGQKPHGLRFRYNPYGRPELSLDQQGSDFCFSVAHSSHVALYAVAQERDVGVDVEEVRHDLDVESIARRFFTGNEAAQLESVPVNSRLEVFLRCWTRKEAYLKATGEGLSRSLNSFAVPLAPGECSRDLPTGDSDGLDRWSFKDLNLGPDFRGSLAVRGEGWQIRTFKAVSPRG